MKAIKQNLTFGQAMNALHNGFKVTRAIWGGYWFIPSEPPVFKDKNGHEHKLVPMILSCLRNGNGFVPAQPYGVDMMATDWEIVK